MADLAFQGFGHPRPVGPATRLECRICWTVYDPAHGDPVWQVPPGTPFDRLPPHWTCPNCSATQDQFIVLDEAPLPDPSPHLVAAFRAAADRLQGLGLVNPALEVEAVGFAPWQQHWLGVLVTPWCMNLVLAPRERAGWQTLAVGGKRKLRFPAGVYEFIGADDAAVGEHQTCSLFSPMHQFHGPDAARLVARLARDALLDPANAEQAEIAQADLSPTGAAATEDSRAGALSKREFLRGVVARHGHVDRR